MKRKIGGYLLYWRAGDHNGTHIHVFDGNMPIGVFDITTGLPTRGLEKHWSRKMKEAVERFLDELKD